MGQCPDESDMYNVLKPTSWRVERRATLPDPRIWERVFWCGVSLLEAIKRCLGPVLWVLQSTREVVGSQPRPRLGEEVSRPHEDVEHDEEDHDHVELVAEEDGVARGAAEGQLQRAHVSSHA